MANLVPEKLINFKVYLDGVDLLGVADVKLPSIETVTDTVKGAGIAGEVDSPTLGHYKSMKLSVKWRTITSAAAILAKQQSHGLELRGAAQVFDAGNGQYNVVPVKVRVNGTPTKFDLGKFEPGTSMESEDELEVNYIKVSIDGNDVIEIDKYNFISKVFGDDYLAGVRAALGFGGGNAVVESGVNQLRSITGI